MLKIKTPQSMSKKRYKENRRWTLLWVCPFSTNAINIKLKADKTSGNNI